MSSPSLASGSVVETSNAGELNLTTGGKVDFMQATLLYLGYYIISRVTMGGAVNFLRSALFNSRSPIKSRAACR